MATSPRPTPGASTLNPQRHRTRRAVLGLAAVATVALGLGVRTVFEGAWTGPAGDVLYAVLIYLLLALVIPAKPRVLIATTALTACALIELLQLTGLPSALGASWPPIRLVLGTTFGIADLLAYAAGCAVTYATDQLLSTAARSRRAPSLPPTPSQHH
jgi:hypothetical protein